MEFQTFTPTETKAFPIRTNDSRCKYPWHSTPVGGSFFVPDDKLPPSMKRLAIPVTVRNAMSFTQTKFVNPKTSESGMLVIRTE